MKPPRLFKGRSSESRDVLRIDEVELGVRLERGQPGVSLKQVIVDTSFWCEEVGHEVSWADNSPVIKASALNETFNGVLDKNCLKEQMVWRKKSTLLRCVGANRTRVDNIFNARLLSQSNNPLSPDALIVRIGVIGSKSQEKLVAACKTGSEGPFVVLITQVQDNAEFGQCLRRRRLG